MADSKCWVSPFFISLLRFIWSEAGASQARQLRLGTLSGSFCCICKWSCTKVDKYGLIAAQSLQYFEVWNICSTKLDPYVHNEIEIKKDSHRFTNQLQIRCHRSPNQVESCYSCPLFVISALPVKGRKTKWKLAELGRKTVSLLKYHTVSFLRWKRLNEDLGMVSSGEVQTLWSRIFFFELLGSSKQLAALEWVLFV